MQTCERMGKSIQIRDVADDVHRTLKARAARQGVSLSQYLRSELERVASSPTPTELLAPLQSRKSITPAESGAAALRAIREEQT